MLRVFIAVLSLMSFVYSDHEKGLLDKLRSNLTKAAPFRAVFIQKVMDVDEILDEAEGELVYSDPCLFKLTYLKPEFKVALFKNNNYLFFDKENEQVTIAKNVNNKKNFLWKFIFDDSMRKYISVDNKTSIIRIIKNDESTDITVKLDIDGMPGKVIHRNGDNTNVYLFSKYRKCIKISKSEFEFTFPEGIEIIEL